jgi:hypothetical protein
MGIEPDRRPVALDRLLEALFRHQHVPERDVRANATLVYLKRPQAAFPCSRRIACVEQRLAEIHEPFRRRIGICHGVLL